MPLLGILISAFELHVLDDEISRSLALAGGLVSAFLGGVELFFPRRL
jgi:hypothetical protein